MLKLVEMAKRHPLGILFGKGLIDDPALTELDKGAADE